MGQDKHIQAAFRAYDGCSLPLLGLAEVLGREAGAANLVEALSAALPSCYIDAVSAGGYELDKNTSDQLEGTNSSCQRPHAPAMHMQQKCATGAGQQ